jgi:hypothetical protein
MTYNRTYEISNLYSQHSQYSIEKPQAPSYESLLQWPSNGYFEKFKNDADLLQQTMSPLEKNVSYSIADQVFGIQKQLEYLNLKHLVNLFYERCQLHKQHIKEIEHSNSETQSKKFCVEINRTPENVKRLSTLEGQLLQLEQQRRDEELSFWKDSAELREKMFEKAGLYRAAKQRYSVFSDVEDKYDR